MLYIGIDPGINTGIAGWYKPTQWLKFTETVAFWRCIEILQYYAEHKEDEPCKVIMEDPNLNKPVFKRNIQNDRRDLKIAQNVGQNKRDAQLIKEFCELKGLEIECVRPTSRKWTKQYFKAITGWNQKAITRTTQHEIDAAKLVYGL